LSVNLEKLLLKSAEPDFQKRLAALRHELSLAGFIKAHPNIVGTVRDIVSKVAAEGDTAVSEFTERFDKVKLSPQQFRVPESELKAAWDAVDKDLLKSFRKSIANVRKYQSEIFIGSTKHPGIRYTPINRVGICVPGGAAPLPSTVIMTAVPAIVAGVKQIVVVSPPRYNDSIHPSILAVCHELGIGELYRIGGAQAVAALAWGTASIPKVDKIAGPGNWYVTLAKREVYGIVDIDSIAGPSEVLIIANSAANPEWVAADMLSQAEHNPDSCAICVTDSQDLAAKVVRELEKQVKELNCSQAASKALQNYGAVIIYPKLDDAVAFANDFAAEHLQIQCGSLSRAIAEKISNAGAIFIGDYTPVAVGDYWAGPSHTLPTGQSAKFFSALSSNDFIKATSIIEYDKQKLSSSAADILRIAQTEGLDAHAKSISIRM
jgi:histidinol dehydrogenase